MPTHDHHRRFDLPFRWPDPPFAMVLVEPEIPPNTGNIARLCVATGTPLHLVGPLGFQLHDRALRRAGVDYWESVDVTRHRNFADFLRRAEPPRVFLFSTAGARSYFDVAFEPGDAFVFGSESRGLPDALLEAYPDRVLQIPMHTEQVRSLNLANSASIVLYEALRQVHARGAAAQCQQHIVRPDP
jgi:tRNA (cytidine/uridine-2'-O-)-methyltransferase